MIKCNVNWLVHWEVKDSEKLLERGLVHAVHHAHLSDEEVEYGAPSRDRPVLLSSRVDFNLGLSCRLQLLTDIQRRHFGDI